MIANMMLFFVKGFCHRSGGVVKTIKLLRDVQKKYMDLSQTVNILP